MGPSAVASFPAEAQQAVDEFPEGMFGAVAGGGQVGDQAGVPEHERDEAVGEDGKDIPFEGRSEVLIDALVIGIRDQPEHG